MVRYKPTNFDEIRKVPDERIENYDICRMHDHAVLEYFKMWMLFVDPDATDDADVREKLVPFVFATPKREHSGNDDRLTAQTWDGEFPPTELERIIYPGMTLTRLDATFDQARFTGAKWKNLSYSDDLNLSEVANFPLPYSFTYQIDFWAETNHDMNSFLEQYARKIPSPTWWLDVDYPPPWGTQTVHMQNQGSFQSNSVLEGGEEQRDLRGVASIIVLGWIPLPSSWVRTIQRVTVDIIEESSQEIIESYISESADKKAYYETANKEEVLAWT